MDAVNLAGGAVVAGFWKVAAIALASALLVVGTGVGTGWWMASAARDLARADLKAEQSVNVELRAGVVAQNTAIQKLGQERSEAEERGRAARALAEANGRRFDSALAGLAGARPTTCEEAMPYVNQLLKDIK